VIVEDKLFIYIGGDAHAVKCIPTIGGAYTTAVQMIKVQEIQTRTINLRSIDSCGEEILFSFRGLEIRYPCLGSGRYYCPEYCIGKHGHNGGVLRICIAELNISIIKNSLIR